MRACSNCGVPESAGSINYCSSSAGHWFVEVDPLQTSMPVLLAVCPDCGQDFIWDMNLHRQKACGAVPRYRDGSVSLAATDQDNLREKLEAITRLVNADMDDKKLGDFMNETIKTIEEIKRLIEICDSLPKSDEVQEQWVHAVRLFNIWAESQTPVIEARESLTKKWLIAGVALQGFLTEFIKVKELETKGEK